MIKQTHNWLFTIVLQTSLLICSYQLRAQTVSIDDCQEKARTNYPLVKQYGLIEKTTAYSLANANNAWLPQLTLNAKATYQSETTKLPITIPNITVPELSKDQYGASLDVTQTIWDGGVTKAQKTAIKAQAEADKQKLEVDLYALKDRINQLFFGILLINEQLTQVSVLKSDLQVNFNRISAFKANGLAGQADIDAIKVEQINALQREIDLQSTKTSFIQMLAAFTGLDINDQSGFEKPILPTVDTEAINNRPELLLFKSQNDVLESQRKMIIAGNMPKAGLFVQGGYGRPGLNMLTNEFSPYYIGGVKLTWNLSGFYSQKNNFDKIAANKSMVDTQKETFLFNNKLQNKQQFNEINKLKSALKNDDEIIALRSNIKKSTSAKVENGTATVNDLLRDVNAESVARQQRLLHEIQLYIAVYQLNNQTNNK